MAENHTAGPGHHGFLWLAGIILFAMGLIALGVLPASCGKNLPRVGRYYQQYCDDCGGDGKVNRSCPSCFGRGYYGGTRCSTCNGVGKVEQSCPYCAGSGKKPEK